MEEPGKTEMKTDASVERIAALERQIEDLKRRMPAHSVKPSMILELETLEEALEELQAKRDNRQ